jgi:hypothetical protein
VNEHPLRLLARFGMTERPAAVAVGIVALLQYLFLAKLWEGYPIRFAGDVIHANVVAAGLALSLIGAAAIATGSLRSWRRGDLAARKLEHPAAHASFGPVRALLDEVAGRSILSGPGQRPALLYTLKNARALEARETGRSGAIVVGLEQRKALRQDPDAFGALLGHEISHLELAATRIETWVRRLTFLHLRILGWLTLVFVVVLGFIDRRGVGSSPALAGFNPVFDLSLYGQLSSQATVLALSAAVVFVYAYFFVVRREHAHDFRGSQLGATGALAERVFTSRAGETASARTKRAITDFAGLHPSTAARQQVLARQDFVLLSAVLYPAIIAAIQPLGLLLTAGWRTVFGIETQLWNLGLTAGAGLLLYMALRADIVRLGIGLLLHPRRYVLQVPLYAAVAGIATQVPRFALEFLFGLRRNIPLSMMGERIWTGFWSGGGRVTLMVALVLLALAYLAAVRIAALGELRAGRLSWFDGLASALVVVGAFAISSLSSPRFMLDVALLLAGVALLYAGVFAVLQRCAACRSRTRLGALRLSTRCACGAEHLPRLRRWTTTPFTCHLMADAGASDGQTSRGLTGRSVSAAA